MPAEIDIYNPEELGPPMGQYTHVTRVRANEFLFVAGMLSGDAAGNVIGEDEFDVQTAQVFRNIEAALKSAGASWANVVQFTTYLVHSQDIPKFMEFRLREFPKMFPDGKYPPNTLLMVDRLVKEAFLVEAADVAGADEAPARRVEPFGLAALARLIAVAVHHRAGAGSAATPFLPRVQPGRTERRPRSSRFRSALFAVLAIAAS